ncbi:MAG: hypothetical protein QM731_19695 [Chitinophagaceae bacterium]
MKSLTFTKRFAVLFIGLAVAQLSLKAQTLKDVFSSSESPLFYYGVDFTKAKLIDDAAANPQDIKERQFAGINDVVVNEPKKYDLAAAFQKSSIDHDLGPIHKKNETVNPEDIKSTTSADYNRFKASDIEGVIKGLETGDKKGVGLVFVVEAMSKTQKAASIWVTLFDIKTKKVLLTERMEGTAGGFGFRNYWAASIKDVMSDIEKKKFKEWKAKYGG